MSPGNHLFWGQQVKGQGHHGHEAPKQRWRVFLQHCECDLIMDSLNNLLLFNARDELLG